MLSVVKMAVGTRNHARCRRLTPMRVPLQDRVEEEHVRLAGKPTQFPSPLRCTHDPLRASQKRVVSIRR